MKKEEGGSSWYHAAIKPTQSVQKREEYDPYLRNPLHAHGDLALPVELNQLSRHFHPTVALFASNIIEGKLGKINSHRNGLGRSKIYIFSDVKKKDISISELNLAIGSMDVIPNCWLFGFGLLFISHLSSVPSGHLKGL